MCSEPRWVKGTLPTYRSQRDVTPAHSLTGTASSDSDYVSCHRSKTPKKTVQRTADCFFCWIFTIRKVKVKVKRYSSSWQVTSELRSVTCHMASHSVTFHPTQVNSPRLTPARQAGTRFTYRYPGGMEGWVDLGDLLHTEMVYPPADGHPSKY